MSGGDDSLVRFHTFGKQPGYPLGSTLTGQKHAVKGCFFSKDGSRIISVGADGAEGSTNEILNELEEQPLLNTIEYAPASKPEIVYGSVTDEDPLIAPDQESVPVPEPDTEIVPLFTAQELGFDDPLDAIEGTALGAAVADAAVLVHPDTD